MAPHTSPAASEPLRRPAMDDTQRVIFHTTERVGSSWWRADASAAGDGAGRGRGHKSNEATRPAGGAVRRSPPPLRRSAGSRGVLS